MSLATLGLSSEIIKALKDKGYVSATPIQKALIPVVLNGHDVMAGAQTGTGKTAGFALPILHNLAQNRVKGKHNLGAIVIVPTRELARQVHESFEAYAKYLPLKSVLLYGGANMTAQANRLKAGVDIIVTTSGRLLEHIGKKNINLEAVRYLVLDEADTILDMGFVHEVMQVINLLPKKRQNILISATLSGSVKRLATDILHKPKLVEVDSMGTSASSVALLVHPVVKERKNELLSFIIGFKNYKQVLVFVRKKQEADEVATELNLSGLKTLVIHGDKSSGVRTRALSAFKEGKIRVLVATDIAARGLDIPNLDLVMNYDIPHVIGDFIHRIGRTGRAGRLGLAITFVSPTEEVALKDVERLLGKAIRREEIEGYTPAVEKVQRGARKTVDTKKKTDGAFGRKKVKEGGGKKRKTTKRDGFKSFDSKPKKEKFKTDTSKRSSSKKRGR
ncbi:MAG: ATP-dependent RNA helicase RhlE [uncultured Sulfurovum sp.]|uniref:ATP-dependent RNA helicase RhlE n=1 Tax=uncultured Sulfurovum sp. TaxID=269237 RepID=A0A6S6T960_9BACT|nr:MAG: ATP-dependent RNA helicase RhlE [uncultured Sulfurovum sp.]